MTLLPRISGLMFAAFLATVPLTGGVVRAETVADVRAQVTVLNSQIQQLRDELVQRGAAGGLPSDPATALTRLDQLDAELRRLTDRIEVLTNDIDRIVSEASNRVSDIEFRLTELEGGDTSLIGQSTQLGGGITRPTPRPRSQQATGGNAQLAISERSDFDAAVAAAEAGNHDQAVELFGTFLATYPGGPLAGEAQYRKAESQAAQDEWQAAARSYLDAFSGAPNGPLAPHSLLGLGVSLGEMGQTSEACLTFREVDIRYPGSEVADEVAAKKASLFCQ